MIYNIKVWTMCIMYMDCQSNSSSLPSYASKSENYFNYYQNILCGPHLITEQYLKHIFENYERRTLSYRNYWKKFNLEKMLNLNFNNNMVWLILPNDNLIIVLTYNQSKTVSIVNQVMSNKFTESPINFQYQDNFLYIRDGPTLVVSLLPLESIIILQPSIKDGEIVIRNDDNTVSETLFSIYYNTAN